MVALGIGEVFYGTRFGNFAPTGVDPELDKFIDSARAVFATSDHLLMAPPLLRRTFMRKTQQLHDDSWDTIFRIGIHVLVFSSRSQLCYNYYYVSAV